MVIVAAVPWAEAVATNSAPLAAARAAASRRMRFFRDICALLLISLSVCRRTPARISGLADPRYGIPATGRELAERFELVVAELDVERCDVLADVVDREAPRNRKHHGRPVEQPGQRDLRRGRIVRLGDVLQRRAVACEREEGHEHDPFALAVVDDVIPPAF